MASKVMVIADNGGGLVLQIGSGHGRYQHRYEADTARQCAVDMLLALAGDDVSGWDGNEVSDGWVTPTDDEIRNGGYRVFSPIDLLTGKAWGAADAALRNALPHAADQHPQAGAGV
jgi:hypothetical protein